MLLPSEWNVLPPTPLPPLFLLRISPDLILMSSWHWVCGTFPNSFRLKCLLYGFFCFFFFCWSSHATLDITPIMTHLWCYDYRFMWLFPTRLWSLWMRSLTESFISASFASSTVPAVNKWLDSASYQLCKLALAHVLALTENQVAGIKEIS